jgi:hypothetical protein
MAYVTPGTVAAGDVATAAAWNVLTNDVIDLDSRLRVFTTEAARDAAITSPSEGMIVYLTAPTIPAATGGSTQIPTGIRTIYNGTNWVCITPIGAYSEPVGTTTSTSYTTTLGGSPGTNATVTLVTGTTARVSVRADHYLSGTGGSFVSVAVSGASTVAASDAFGIYQVGHTVNQEHAVGTTFMISGLTAGTNTFSLSYRVTTATGSFYARGLIVEGIA